MAVIEVGSSLLFPYICNSYGLTFAIGMFGDMMGESFFIE